MISRVCLGWKVKVYMCSLMALPVLVPKLIACSQDCHVTKSSYASFTNFFIFNSSCIPGFNMPLQDLRDQTKTCLIHVVIPYPLLFAFLENKTSIHANITATHIFITIVKMGECSIKKTIAKAGKYWINENNN